MFCMKKLSILKERVSRNSPLARFPLHNFHYSHYLQALEALFALLFTKAAIVSPEGSKETNRLHFTVVIPPLDEVKSEDIIGIQL